MLETVAAVPFREGKLHKRNLLNLENLARVDRDVPQWGRPPKMDSTADKGALMFEYDQPIVQSLLDNDVNFQRLFQRHHLLKEKVRGAETGTLPLDDLTLCTIKKEKLMTKDKMAAIISDYQHAQ